MAWMASHIFFQLNDQTVLVEAVQELLGRTPRSSESDPPEPFWIGPPHEGWIAITGVRGWLDDLPRDSQELSAAGHCRALCCEIFGNCYRLRLSEFSAGEKVRIIKTPGEGWDEDPGEAALMPLYEDAERMAYTALREAGVPPSLITLGTSPLGYAARSALELGRAVRLFPVEGKMERSEQVLRVVPFEGDEPPVLPCEMGRDFGLMLFETRYVEGRPSTGTVERLLQIEETFLARARRAQPEDDLTLTVMYHTGVYQNELDALLRARGRPTATYAERGERVPWWQFWRFVGRLR
jgi:hypothetical protein